MSTTTTPVTLAGGTQIEWADYTHNPWWGCARVSPACNHCYAETLAHRYGHDVWGKGGDRRFFGDKHWNEPLKWDRKAAAAGVRRRVFCASMADVFEARDDLDVHRLRLWHLIEATPNLDWLLLTKRPENINRMVPDTWLEDDGAFTTATCSLWPHNVWVGTTVEDQKRADERIPLLQAVPAHVRFLSCEPLLEAITPDLTGISWVIAGGESGPGARPMHPEWVRDIRDQCWSQGSGICRICQGSGSVQVDAQGFAACPDCYHDNYGGTGRTPVRFLFKQWGEWAPALWKPRREPHESFDAYKRRAAAEGATHSLGADGRLRELDHAPWSMERTSPGSGTWTVGMRRVGKKAAGRLLDGRTWDEIPEVPA